jgi:hypothetical protein
VLDNPTGVGVVSVARAGVGVTQRAAIPSANVARAPMLVHDIYGLNAPILVGVTRSPTSHRAC